MTAASKYTFLGDLMDTATSAVVVDGRLHVLDKAALTLIERVVTPTGTDVTIADLLGATGKAVSKFSGNSVFYLYKGADEVTNLFRVDVTTGALTQVTAGHGAATIAPTKIHSVTDGWVVYGTDGLMLAARKSGTGSRPVLLAENTRTSGIRYPFNFGIGSQYLFVKYRLDAATGHTTYDACVFGDDGTTTCREDSFWAGVFAARQGTLNFTSDYPYTPYAFVRVDDTDDFGGGTLKAVDPTTPLDEGFAVGSVPRYNFNTFLHATHYLKTTVDTDGWIVVYGKSDETFVGDAFLLNLRQANSVRNLTNEAAPSTGALTGGDLHCHGRTCATCHNFAGGKLYGNAAGSVEAVGYAVKLAFEDGSSVTSRHAKGKGENFSFLHDAIKGDFTPIIVTSDGATEIKRGEAFGHSGLSNSNCNYCHARGTLRHGAPAVLNITR